MSQIVSLEAAGENLFDCAVYMTEQITSADGRAEALGAVLPVMLAADRVDDAAALADEVDDPFTRDRLLTAVAERCATINDDDYAAQLVDAIEDFGSQSMAREKLGLVKSGQGDFAAAFTIAEAIEHPDNVYAAIAVNATADGASEFAARALSMIEFPYTRVIAHQTVAATHLAAGARDVALEHLEKALVAADEIDLLEEKLRALTDIAAYFTEANRRDRAIETLDGAKQLALTLDNAHRDPFLALIAFGFFKAGSVDLADPTLDLVVDKVQIASVLTGFARLTMPTDLAEATDTLEEAVTLLESQTDREIRDSRARYALFGTIAELFIELGKEARGVEVAESIKSETERFGALVAIARKAAELGRDDFAADVIRAIPEDSYRLNALVAIAVAQHDGRRPELSKASLVEAVSFADSVPQLSSRAAALAGIARLLAKLGDEPQARATASLALATVAELRDESQAVVALTELSQVYDELGFALTDDEKMSVRVLIRKVTG